MWGQYSALISGKTVGQSDESSETNSSSCVRPDQAMYFFQPGSDLSNFLVAMNRGVIVRSRTFEFWSISEIVWCMGVGRNGPALKRILRRRGFFQSAGELLPPNDFRGSLLVRGLRRTKSRQGRRRYLDDGFWRSFAQCLVSWLSAFWHCSFIRLGGTYEYAFESGVCWDRACDHAGGCACLPLV